MRELPIYDIKLSDDSQGVGFISLVDEPAIGVDWIKLSSQAQLSFKVDKEKQLLYGPFLIPNKLIYRHDEKMGEYYVRFSKEEIEKIASKFNEDLNNKNINFQHSDQKVEAFVTQNWMIDGEQDKSRNMGFDLPEGTWFGGVKIKDESFWIDKVKTDEVKGFSVEILADLELALKNKEQKMEKQIKLGTAVLKDGVTVYWDGEFGMGTAIFIDEALTQPAPDADHVLEDGTIVTTEGGKVVEIQVSSVEEEASKKKKDEEMIGEEPATPMAITTEEVSSMIDARFAELMDEITRLKELVGQKDETINEFKKEVEEKFSMTAATKSITKAEPKQDDKFSKVEARIREFAKNK
jgi:uncharacterized small protein (DUF1192 family)